MVIKMRRFVSDVKFKTQNRYTVIDGKKTILEGIYFYIFLVRFFFTWYFRIIHSERVIFVISVGMLSEQFSIKSFIKLRNFSSGG